MAGLLASYTPRLLTAEEFAQIDFGPGLRAELDNGVIRMMAGGNRDHARVHANLIVELGTRLRGSGCRPYGSDMAIRTHDLSVRYPDVAVDCGSLGDSGADLHLTAPRAIVEILSPLTRDLDLWVKREEYRALPTLDTLVFVDPDAGTLSVHQRIPGGWTVQDLAIPSLDVVIAAGDIFAPN